MDSPVTVTTMLIGLLISNEQHMEISTGNCTGRTLLDVYITSATWKFVGTQLRLYLEHSN
jgi:hypothetical protein